MENKRAYIILGMHRSATSFVAKALSGLGVNMGKRLLPANEWNEQGHFENLDFIELNNAILEKAGGDWKNVPSEEDIIKAGDYFREEIKKVIKNNRDEKWGFKDPRTALTGLLYLPYLEETGDDTYLIAVFRKPKKVVESLKKRSNLPEDKSWQLARQYNERILKTVKNFLGI